MKQTAVEWLVETLNKKYGNDDFIITFINEIEQAKEMEKEQIIEAYQKGVIDGYGDSLDFSNCSDAENYYKQKYGANK
jgi:hypothetical protein